MTEEEQSTEKADVVCDTSLLLNFVQVERLDLLADHPAYRFHLPAEVRAEVIRPQQAADLRRWLVEGGLREIRLATREELELFAELDAVLDRGEAASIAAAVSQGWVVAMDEGGRARREVLDDLAPAPTAPDTILIVGTTLGWARRSSQPGALLRKARQEGRGGTKPREAAQTSTEGVPSRSQVRTYGSA